MAFSCKLPLSRRQFWERTTGLSQFSREAFKAADAKEPKADFSERNSSTIATAAAPLSKSHRLSKKQQQQQQEEGERKNNRGGSNDYYYGDGVDHYYRDETTGKNHGEHHSSSVQIELKYLDSSTVATHHDTEDSPDTAQRHDDVINNADSIVCTPAKINFSRVDVIFICFSIILYIADIGLDCSVAYKHHLTVEEDPLYFIFTIVFVLLAGIVTSIFSVWWYYFEYQLKKERTPNDKPTRVGFIVRIVACSLSLGPVVRYIDTIWYGLRSRAKGINSELRQYYHDEMQYQRADGAMLRLFEAFLESAPQFLLQVYIVLKRGLDGEREGNHFLVAITIASIASSVVSLSWSVVAYHKALRMSRHDVDDIEHFGLAFRFLWRLFEISPRIVILAMFMSAFGFYLGIFAALHFSLMVVWLYKLHTNFCEKPRCEIVFVTVTALIWCFCFFNLKDGHTRRTSLLFYILFFAENIGLTLGWLYETQDQHIWYRHIVFPIVLGSMLPMIASMVIYYKFLHRQEIKTCLPWSYWTSCADDADVTASVRYSKGDGTGIERERLTQHNRGGHLPSVLPAVLPSQTGSSAADVSVDQQIAEDEGIADSSLPVYRAPSPTRQADEGADAGQGDAVPAANLDGCVEVNGYLESQVLAKPASKLMRQDTMPKYMAPVPCHYGSTVPGGAPAVYTLSITKPAVDPSHGSTLPGAPSIATVVNNERFVPYDEERPSHTPRRPLMSTKSSVDKPPVPEPRLSLHHEASSTVTKSPSQSSLCDESNLTTISELQDNHSSLFDETLSPSPRRPINGQSMDNSVLDITPAHVSPQMRDRSADAVSNSSSLDTPLKPGTPISGKLDLSIDTPVKDLLKSRSSDIS